jgi:hypothetical protein
MVIPGATIYTLIDLMLEPALIRPYLVKLEDEDPTAATFLETQFFSATFFDGTRQQIQNRLWNVLSTTKALLRFSKCLNCSLAKLSPGYILLAWSLLRTQRELSSKHLTKLIIADRHNDVRTISFSRPCTARKHSCANSRSVLCNAR